MPVIGVPLLIAVAIIAMAGTRKGWWKHQERRIASAQPQRLERNSSLQSHLMRGSDPQFDEAHFLGRVRHAFETAQTSWCRQELEPLRAFVSDGVLERFTLQIEEQQQDGWQQDMEGVRIGALTLVHVESGAHFDTLSVRIPFQANIQRRDLNTRQVIAGSKLPTMEFTECWSFVRRRGTQTMNRAGLMEGMCPACGAPLQLNQSAI